MPEPLVPELHEPPVPEGAAKPLDATDFTALMAPLEPFERCPQLAVAVSGGPDSRALALLAAAWAVARGGAVTGLVVDHGLRPEAAAEAATTGAWLRHHGIAAVALSWTGPKPASGIEAAARTARHRLLQTWCRERGVLHLLLAHHQGDQAETVALRRARGSGPDGLAAMAARREVEGLRLLRPLLAVAKDQLIATLVARGQDWIEDPSNHAPRFARARLRAGTLDQGALLATARAHGARRTAADHGRAAWLARNVNLAPTGFALVARSGLAPLADDQLAAVLQRLVMTIGAGGHPPRGARLLGLVAWLRAGAASRGRTLAGCRILPQGDRLLVCREPRAVEPDRPASGARWQRWDRFLVSWSDPAVGDRLGALGDDGWRQRRALAPGAGDGRSVPAPVGPTLPAVWGRAGLLAVPHLGWRDPARPGGSVAVRFRPERALAEAPFAAWLDAGAGDAAAGSASSLLRAPDSLC